MIINCIYYLVKIDDLFTILVLFALLHNLFKIKGNFKMRIINNLKLNYMLTFISMILLAGCGSGGGGSSTSPGPIVIVDTTVLKASIDVGGIQLVGTSSSGKKYKFSKEEDEYLRSNCTGVKVYKIDGTIVGSAEQDTSTKKWKIDLKKNQPHIIKARIKGNNGVGSFFSERIIKSNFDDTDDVAVNDDTSKVYSRVLQVASHNGKSLSDIEDLLEDEITDAEKTIEAISNGTFLNELTAAIDSNKTDAEKAEIIKAGIDELTALLAIFNEMDKRFSDLESGNSTSDLEGIISTDFDVGGSLDVLTLTDTNSDALSTQVTNFINSITVVINLQITIESNQINIKNSDNINLVDPDSITISQEDLESIRNNNAVPSIVLNGLKSSTLEIGENQSLNFLVETLNPYTNSIFTVVVQDESIVSSVLSNTASLKFSEVLKLTGLKAGTTIVTLLDSSNNTQPLSFNVTVNASTDHPKPLITAIGLTTTEDTVVIFDLNNLIINAEVGLNYVWDASQDTGAKGTISITNNLLTYTPNANVNGLDSFNIKVNNGFEDSDTIAIGVTIISVNDTPVLSSQSLSTIENEALTLDLTTLGTDSDNGQQLAYLLSSNPTNGTASITNSILTYTPNASFSGSDSLSITINDGIVSSSAVVFPITVLLSGSVPNAPIISSITANDPDNADAVFSNQDTITIVFDVPTNQPAVTIKSSLDNIFTFSQSLGTNYTGVWSSSTTLVITMVDTTGNGSPIVGTFSVTAKSAGGLKNATGTSLPSSSASGVLTGDFGIFTTIPTNTVAVTGDSQITVSWDTVTNATSYNIYFSTSSGVTTGSSKITGVTSPYIHTGLTNGTAYYYVITAVISSVESALSSEANATPVAVVVAPSAPASLTAVKGNAQNVLTWSTSSGATSYNLYHATSSGVTTGSTKLATVTSPYSHTGLTNGTTYYYVVTAVNAAGESAVSSEVNATPFVADITSDLVAHWKFENNGDDSSGSANVHNMTIAGATYVADKNATPNSALSFDGINDTAQTPYHADFDLPANQDLTISAWVKRETGEDAHILTTIGTNTSQGFYMYVSTTGAVYHKIANNVPEDIFLSSAGAVPVDTWTHILISNDRTTGIASLYINGVFHSASGVFSNTKDSNIVAVRPAYIGSNIAPLYYKIQVDEIRFYRRALTQADITELAALPSDPGSSGSVPVININDPLPYQNNYIEFTYILTDTENDVCTINAEYSIDAGTNWFTATLIGTTSNLTPGLDTKSIIWNMKSDLNTTSTETVLLKLRGTDSSSGSYDTSNGVSFSTHNKTILYVDADNGTPGNGSSWLNSFDNVQDALTNSAGDDELWIADGSYVPGNVKNIHTFELLTGVEVYGGFVGTESFRYQRNWKINKTIFSGDINGDTPGGTTSDDIYHVVTSQTSGLIDGITIKYGYRGIVCVGSANTIIANCTITSNTNILGVGGGFYNSAASPILINCEITNNTAADNGGGMFNGACSPVIINCNFSGNTANGIIGGGIYNNSSPAMIFNCTFTGNTSADRGGAICNVNSSSKIINCTITGNNAINNGGAISNESSSSTVITNSIIWGNKINGVLSTNMADEIYNNSSTPIITYSIVKGITVSNGNLDSDPLFTTPGSDYTLGNSSPAENAGNNDAAIGIDLNGDGGGDGDKVTTDSSLDIKGEARIKNGTVDMGANEK
ncbi:MAG: hypothetical protein COA79_05735 [Planctomycetota bacterium]|nr:MAG: hypothetical protein COA79_05735 [Planctomycetota bacterium]